MHHPVQPLRLSLLDVCVLSRASRISLYRRSGYPPAGCRESADADKQRSLDVSRASEFSKDGWSVAYEPRTCTWTTATKLMGDLHSLPAASFRHQEGSIRGFDSKSAASNVGRTSCVSCRLEQPTHLRTFPPGTIGRTA